MSGSDTLSQLREAAPAILPSLLLCDFGNLEREVDALQAAGVPALHLDVMDGQFVPNLTYGLPIVSALRRLTELPLDVHLMIAQPERYIQPFVDAGSDVITVHVEATQRPREALQMIRDQGVAAGLALNPNTALKRIRPCLDLCDAVLVMSVQAGFGGQSFNPVALEKLAALRQQLSDDVLLEVDSGVNAETIAACAHAGASLFVVGSAIFNTDDYAGAVSQLRGLASVAA